MWWGPKAVSSLKLKWTIVCVCVAFAVHPDIALSSERVHGCVA